MKRISVHFLITGLAMILLGIALFLTPSTAQSQSLPDTQETIKHLDTLAFDALATDVLLAVTYASEELRLSRITGNMRQEANALEILGFAMRQQAHYDSAMSFHTRALDIRTTLRDTEDIAASLNNLFEICQITSWYDRSNQYLDSLLLLLTSIRDPFHSAVVLNNIALNFMYLGSYDSAMNYYERAIHQSRIISDSADRNSIIASANAGIGNIELQRKHFRKSIRHFLSAITAFQNTNLRSDLGVTYGNLLLAYEQLGDTRKTQQMLDSALAIARETQSPADTVAAASRRGIVFRMSRHYKKALEIFDQSVDEYHKLRLTEGEASTYFQLLKTAVMMNNPALAIFFGKQGVNLYQNVRSRIRELPPGLQKDYLVSREKIYRVLADLLIRQGRLGEAEQVITMMKDEEYHEYLRGGGGAETRADFTPVEYRWKVRADSLRMLIDSLDSRVLNLELLPNLTASQQSDLAACKNGITRIQQKKRELFAALVRASTSWGRISGDLETLESRATEIEKIVRTARTGVGALITLVADRNYEVILITEQGRFRAVTPIREDTLYAMVERYRLLLLDAKSDPRPLGNRLYKILVAPLMPAMKKAQIKTILWSLDGPLRYLPVSALYTGHAFLVDSFASTIVTPSALPPARRVQEARLRALGMGVSKSLSGFPALPYVAEELRTIIGSEEVLERTGIIPGKIKLDEQFTRDGFFRDLRLKYPVIHLATHFQLRPGSGRSSFLLLGDGSRLTIDTIAQDQDRFAGVDLLTLSACNTANRVSPSGGREVESFAVSAQKRGARAVLATLWSISDESTPQLMKLFYGFKAGNPGMTTAQALQEAQKCLLYDRMPGEIGVRKRRPPYAHPFHWAPFILTGDWK